MRDYYETVAQVMPVILLALVWESHYFEELARRERAPRFWTLGRIRVYMLSVATAAVAVIVACILVLAGALDDSAALRGAIMAGLVWALGTLLFRIWVHVLDGTHTDDPEN